MGYWEDRDQFKRDATEAGHGYRYQDIGPIHYLCDCGDYFLNGERWAEHVGIAKALAVVKEACDIECKSPGKHTGCSSHEPYRVLRDRLIRSAMPQDGTDA